MDSFRANGSSSDGFCLADVHAVLFDMDFTLISYKVKPFVPFIRTIFARHLAEVERIASLEDLLMDLVHLFIFVFVFVFVFPSHISCFSGCWFRALEGKSVNNSLAVFLSFLFSFFFFFFLLSIVLPWCSTLCTGGDSSCSSRMCDRCSTWKYSCFGCEKANPSEIRRNQGKRNGFIYIYIYRNGGNLCVWEWNGMTGFLFFFPSYRFMVVRKEWFWPASCTRIGIIGIILMTIIIIMMMICMK